ncbi:heparinase II/III domain-containing protein [Larkinella soli]|uniref:heparinase II/III domain-containing protein n=1 Tax=Larkinella soli TaxID=1770527 RepID=UPI000FFCAB02|nr:heparinase II/III family protein [Larkinella soli]
MEKVLSTPHPVHDPPPAREPVFLTTAERQAILTGRQEPGSLLNRFYAALRKRVYERVETGGLLGPDARTLWYYPTAEYLSDAALLYALEPEQRLADWIHRVGLELARRSAGEWVGPPFRSHAEPLTGHLETAHLGWGLAAVLDLADAVYTEDERTEIRTALREKGIALCRRWLDTNTHLANWRGILTAGVLVPAAVLGDANLIDEMLPLWTLCAGAFQSDGSYGESLQYGNYLSLALTLAYEAVCRRFPEKAAALDVSAYGRGMAWVASSMFYAKPLADPSGRLTSDEPRARAANFNDSAALFRPSGDVLLHLAARSASETERGLARGLFDRYYAPVPEQGPHDLATFGMRNDWGFLTLPLLTHPSRPLSPEAAGVSTTASFSNGHAFLRDAWEGDTVVAVNGGGDPLCGPGHLHGDLNSFILVHRQERLLVDPGHSCYRNLIHGLESATQTHNTCTFLVENEALGLQEDLAKAVLLEQKSVLPRRNIIEGRPGEPVDRGNRRLIVARQGEVSVVGAEAGAAYGPPIRRFERFWLLAGSRTLFVIDRIEADVPVTTVWNWLVNHRDGQARFDAFAGGMTVRRNGSALKLFHGGTARPSHPVYGFVHDAYHVEPNQEGEGRSGSGLLFRWTETAPAHRRLAIHALALDTADRIDEWTLTKEENRLTLTDGRETWTLAFDEETFRLLSGSGRQWTVQKQDHQWLLLP